MFGAKGQATYADYTWSALIPLSFLGSDEDHDTVVDVIKRCARGPHVMAGNVAISGDGMDALSKGFRSAGLQQMIRGETYSWCVEALQKMTLKHLGVENTTNPTIPFPGFTEINHQTGWGSGPLKSDWSLPCPQNFTTEERRELCMTVQEAEFGTENYERLLKIKKTIDKHNLFSVHFGVGNDEVIGPVPAEYIY